MLLALISAAAFYAFFFGGFAGSWLHCILISIIPAAIVGIITSKLRLHFVAAVLASFVYTYSQIRVYGWTRFILLENKINMQEDLVVLVVADSVGCCVRSHERLANVGSVG
jgi:uncharacterized membrane protein YjjP (DUF1212 family)